MNVRSTGKLHIGRARNANLKEFTNLVSIQGSGNEFTDLDWLFTLPASSQKKLKWLNLWGNKIENVDFTRLLNNFPNLESINLENNPLNGNNLDGLSDQQFSCLLGLVEAKKLKINSWKGTFLLSYFQSLIFSALVIITPTSFSILL